MPRLVPERRNLSSSEELLAMLVLTADSQSEGVREVRANGRRTKRVALKFSDRELVEMPSTRDITSLMVDSVRDPVTNTLTVYIEVETVL